MKSVVLKPGRLSLTRKRDGAGDSGPMWRLFDGPKTIESNEYVWVDDAKPGEIRVGCGIRCGSITARSFSAQDWWQCSPVTEILKVNDDKTEVEFKTGNSIYIAKSF